MLEMLKQNEILALSLNKVFYDSIEIYFREKISILIKNLEETINYDK
jgi:hypothetical protein